MTTTDDPVVPALRRLSRAASGSVLVVATVAFFGGWMFDVRALRNLVPGTIEIKPFTAAGLFCSASVVAEDLRSCIAERCAPLTCTAWTTVSIGVAHFSQSEGVDDVMARTDQAMYAAKRSGGDRVANQPSPDTQRATLTPQPTLRSDLRTSPVGAQVDRTGSTEARAIRARSVTTI